MLYRMTAHMIAPVKLAENPDNGDCISCLISMCFLLMC